MKPLLLVNKKNKLDKFYIPKNLVEVKDGIESGVNSELPQVIDYVYEAFKELQKEASKYNFKIFINSGYRSYETQEKLIINFIEKNGYEEAISLVAPPGTSEHQTGLAIDFAVLESIEDNHKNYVRGINMWEDKATNWVLDNAHNFGFIFRFQKNKELITNQKAEPWHLRYVGIEHAKEIYKRNMCLEEYLIYKNIEFNGDDLMETIPLIGIVGRVENSAGGHPIIGTGDYYRKCLSKNEASVISILPPQDLIYNENSPKLTPRMTEEEKIRLDKVLNLCDGIILPGGSKWYEFDEYICNYALEKDLPLLGICLGMQTMAYLDNLKVRLPVSKTYRNKTEFVHQDLDSKYVHKVILDKESTLSKLFKTTEIEVNSRHNYNIGEFTNEFDICGYSEDGIPEYFENGKNAIGVQWHPELMVDYDKNMDKLIKYFVDKCKNSKKF